MNKFLSCAFASAFAVSAFAAAVRTLPEPDADGYYVFGAPYTYSKTTAYEWKGDCNQPAFPVWSEIGLPNNAKVKFVGGVILDSFPANVAEIDCSELTFMAIIKSDIKNLAGQKLLIPEGAKLCLSNTKSSYPTWSGDAMTAWAETHALFKLHADIEVNGTLCW